MSKFGPVFFCNEQCSVDISQKYASGMRRIQLYCVDGEPMATATTNLPEEYANILDSDPNMVFIKNYSENKGILDALVKGGIISKGAYLEGTNGGICIATIKVQLED